MLEIDKFERLAIDPMLPFNSLDEQRNIITVECIPAGNVLRVSRELFDKHNKGEHHG